MLTGFCSRFSSTKVITKKSFHFYCLHSTVVFFLNKITSALNRASNSFADIYITIFNTEKSLLVYFAQPKKQNEYFLLSAIEKTTCISARLTHFNQSIDVLKSWLFYVQLCILCMIMNDIPISLLLFPSLSLSIFLFLEM